ASDGQERRNADIYNAISEYFNLSDAEKRERLPGGSQLTYQNRCNWATIYLYNAGLLERPQRGVYRISEAGQKLLSKKPDRIDISVLNEFPQFLAWRAKGSKRKASSKSSEEK